eukprot:6484491-Amphidinium_carterae.1
MIGVKCVMWMEVEAPSMGSAFCDRERQGAWRLLLLATLSLQRCQACSIELAPDKEQGRTAGSCCFGLLE